MSNFYYEDTNLLAPRWVIMCRNRADQNWFPLGVMSQQDEAHRYIESEQASDDLVSVSKQYEYKVEGTVSLDGLA